MNAPRISPWSCALALLGAIIVSSSLFSTIAHAGTPAPPWSFDWRPGWVPGDPMDEPSIGAAGWLAPAGLYVALDPVTRRPVAPSVEQRRAFQAAIDLDQLLAPSAPPTVEKLPGGGEIVQLNGAFQSFSIARRDASGRFVVDCAPDGASARRLLATPLTPGSTPQKEER
jgi:hypothetical protein